MAPTFATFRRFFVWGVVGPFLCFGATRPNLEARWKAAELCPTELDVFRQAWLMCVIRHATQTGDRNMPADDHETKLRDAFQKMDPHQYQEIRDAYYKAVEGLQTLAQALEFADIEVGEANDHVLIQEHLTAVEAIHVMNQSLLGRIL